MFYAILHIAKGTTGRHMNSKTDVQAQLGRGDVTPDGKLIAGVGTYYPDVATAQRDKELDRQCNALRTAFKQRFVIYAIPGVESSFVIDAYGQGTKFLEDYREGLKAAGTPMDPQIQTIVTELETYGPPTGVPSAIISKWEEAIKEQIVNVALGRKRDEVAASALAVFDALAACPSLSPETANALTKLAAQYRQGNMDKDEFQRVRNGIVVKVKEDALGQTQRSITPIKRVVLPTEDTPIER